MSEVRRGYPVFGVASAEGNRPRESTSSDAEIADLTATISAHMGAPVPAAPNEPLTEDSLADFAYDLLNLWYIEDTNEPSLIEQFCDNFRDRFGIPGAAHDAQVRDAALTEAADSVENFRYMDFHLRQSIIAEIRSLQEGNK